MVNVGAVPRKMATGNGVSRLQQMVGVPSVLKKTFTSTEIMEEVEWLLTQSMLEAGTNRNRQ